MFHTDRGKEFDNVLNTFGIQRLLSMKGCPYDNAVVKAQKLNSLDSIILYLYNS